MKNVTFNGFIGSILIAALLISAAIGIFWTPMIR